MHLFQAEAPSFNNVWGYGSYCAVKDILSVLPCLEPLEELKLSALQQIADVSQRSAKSGFHLRGRIFQEEKKEED